jgi:polysaccharide biosynthesis transport protein
MIGSPSAPTGRTHMHALARPPSEDIVTASLWAVLLRSWLRVLVVSGMAGALTFAALSLTQQYFAAAIQLRAASVTAVAEALRSREIAETLVAELDLAQSPAFNTALAPDRFVDRLLRAVGIGKPRPGQTVEEAVLAAYQRSLRVTPSRDAGAVSVEFISPSPELSSRAVSRLATLYQASTSGGRAAPVTPVDRSLAEEIEALAQDVAAAEAAVAEARKTAGSARDAANVGTVDPQLADLAEAVVLARRARDDAEARTRSVRALIEKGQVEAIPEVQPSPVLHELIAERVRTEVQKTAAERSLPAGHPRIGELQTRLSELRWRMYREATSLVDDLERAAVAAALSEGQARARLDRARADAPEEADDAARLAALEADAVAKRSALAAMRVRHAAGGPSGAHTSSASAANMSPPQASALPVSPRKAQLALLAAVSTLMIGFVVVILRELVAGTRRTPLGSEFADLAAAARDRATIRVEPPRRDAGDNDPREPGATVVPVADPDSGHFAILSSPNDAARHIASIAGDRRGYRSLLVGNGIDGAAEARDLVADLATSRRPCVMIDWSWNGKGIAPVLGLQAQPGINDLLGGRATFDDVIVRLPDSDAHFIACGAPIASGTPLDPDWIGLVLDALDETYDHVVVVAQLESARALFEAIEGRFDAGIVMSERRAHTNINAAPGVFLGFEVTEIYVVQMDLTQRSAMPARKLKRAKRQASI